MKYKALFFFFLCSSALLSAMTIEEKKESYLGNESSESGELGRYLDELNRELITLRSDLETKYAEASSFHERDANAAEYKQLLKEVNVIKSSISSLETGWRERAITEAKKDEEGYAIWDQEETTLSSLVMEYGANDFLYVVPPEMFSMKVSMHSALPIPRESWDDLLEIILSHNGIGIKQLNPYTRQLYILKQDLIAVKMITSDVNDLPSLPSNARVAFIFSPPPERIKGVTQFFERFRDPKMTFVYQVGYKIALISSKEEVEKLITLYTTVWEQENEKVTRAFPLSKLSTNEMESILNSFFSSSTRWGRLSLSHGEGDGLTILPLAREASLVVVGLKEMVDKVEQIITETEEQIEDPSAMTVFWYTCRHSDPIEISEVMEKVYASLIYSGIEGEEPIPHYSPMPPTRPLNPDQGGPSNPASYGPPPYSPVIYPPVAIPTTAENQKEKSYTTNFIPYPKTGAIMMVVRKDTLEKIKELLVKLDIPKKMVQIEVLLFEKKIDNQNNFGLNLLKLGSAAKNVHETGLSYDGAVGSPVKGILEFFISRPKTSKHIPAYDLAYNFLMSQQDVRINASPSITTLNQTPAQISIVEEISINNGAAPIDNNANITFEKSFSRQEYGTTIVITPTIHEPEMGDQNQTRYVTLETNVEFDTITSDVNDRPKVNKRHLENQVRVMDGETVILGGIRRKSAEDVSEKIPFLGELPGIGKFFGTSRMTDQLTEMFIFITPQIIADPEEDLIRIRNEALRKRPGDLPEFLEQIEAAKSRQKKKLFANSFKLLFGSVDD